MRLALLFTIFRKEITEALRDRTTLMVVIALPMLVYPLMIMGVGKLQRNQAASEDRRASVIAVWGEASQTVSSWLQRSNLFELTNGLGLPMTLQASLDPRYVEPAAPESSSLGTNVPPISLHAAGLAGTGNTSTPSSAVPSEELEKTLQARHSGIKLPPENAVLEAARDLVARREVDAVLVLWPGLAESIHRHGLGAISIYHDSVRASSQKARERLAEALAELRRELVHQREQTRGLARGFSSALEIRAENVAPPQRRTGQALGLALPFVLIMLSATGALYASIDLTAGEKDRATMQTLLCAPVNPLELVAGKFLAVWCISLIASLANTLSLGFTVGAVAAQLGGLSIHPWTVLLVMPCLLPVTCTISALFLAVAVMARDAKDAGNFLSATLIILMMPMGIALAPNVELTPLTAFVPMVNVALLVKSIFIGDVRADLVFLTLLAAGVYAMVALLFAARAFRQEEILLGGKGGARALFRPDRAPDGLPTPGVALGVFALVLVGIFYGSLAAQKAGIIGTILISQYGFFLLPIVLITCWIKFSVRDTFSLRLPHWRSVIGCVLLGGSSAIAVAGIALRLMPAPESLVDGMQKILLLGETPAPLWVIWLVIAVTPALCEETVFRGLILAGFRRLGAVKAIVLSAFLFALAHSSIYRLLPTFALGLIFGYAVWRTGSIYCSMLIHALNNGLIATLVYLESTGTGGGSRLQLEKMTVVPWSWTLIAAGVMALGLFLLRPASPPPVRDETGLMGAARGAAEG
jgi:sodium transport system permease protein